ncbi:MAG TPA: SAM-dependent methyltransferase, partial [Actinomycetota bacterium]
MSAPFEPGEQVLLIDQRDRTYLFSLEAGAVFHTHAGTLAHDELVGRPEGARVTTSRGMVLTAFRPRFADYVLKMPRGAQVVYPKDLGPIVVYADVFPGARVLEAGTGSGALTIALCRAVGDQGRVVSYEVRPEHRDRAVANIEGFFGKLPDQLELREGDVSDAGGSGDRFDRVVLDVAEPWGCLPGIRPALEAGAVLCAYLPTTGQLQQLV